MLGLVLAKDLSLHRIIIEIYAKGVIDLISEKCLNERGILLHA